MGKRGYYIQIVKSENKYYFQLWYSGHQAMGCSKSHESYDKCMSGVQEFKNVLSRHSSLSDDWADLIKLDERQYVYRFYDSNRNTIYKSRVLEVKKNCQDSMESTFKEFPNADYAGLDDTIMLEAQFKD